MLFGCLFVVLVLAIYRKVRQRKLIQESIPLTAFDGIANTTVAEEDPRSLTDEENELDEMIQEYKRVRQASLTTVRRKLNFDG